MKFELELNNRNLTDEELIFDLKLIAKKSNKNTLTGKEYKDNGGKYGVRTYQTRYGSWLKALEKAGLPIQRTTQKLEREKIIEDLKLVAKKLNTNVLTGDEYTNNGEYSYSGVCRHFNSWYDALKAAGLETKKIGKISDEELFHNLEEIWIKLTRQPKSTELIKPLSKYSSDTYADRFGTWNKALIAFINYVNSGETDCEKENLIDSVAIELNDKPEDITLQKHKTSRTINWRLRFLVLRRDNFKCKCGRSPATDPNIILHVDHIDSWDSGGETVFENLQTLCSVCNIGKSNLDMYE